jgi:hypothetical protein
MLRTQVPGRVGGAVARQPAVPLHRRTAGILVVDDEPMIRALARWALELYGYEVLEAEDGEAAMDGRELSALLHRQWRGIGVLYI